MHANLDWATCGKCLKPGCFQILASDLHLRAVPGGGGAGGVVAPQRFDKVTIMLLEVSSLPPPPSQ